MPRFIASGAPFLNLSPFNTDPHHLAIAYRLQFGNADFYPRCFEVLDDDLRDVFGQGFEQVEVVAGERALDVAHDVGVVERVVDVVSFTGAAVWQRDFQVYLQGLRYALFPFVDADEGFDFEFAQKDDVHRSS